MTPKDVSSAFLWKAIRTKFLKQIQRIKTIIKMRKKKQNFSSKMEINHFRVCRTIWQMPNSENQIRLLRLSNRTSWNLSLQWYHVKPFKIITQMTRKEFSSFKSKSTRTEMRKSVKDRKWWYDISFCCIECYLDLHSNFIQWIVFLCWSTSGNTFRKYLLHYYCWYYCLRFDLGFLFNNDDKSRTRSPVGIETLTSQNNQQYIRSPKSYSWR